MKENRYDDQEFFEKYSHMSRSEKGLAGAGEWPVLQAMLPDFTQKQVLDLGCGYGWHCRYAMEKGAASVLGIDLSEKMLDQARKINQPAGVEYLRCALEDYAYPAETYDIVISSLTLHYIEDLSALFRKVAQTLRTGGEFIFRWSIRSLLRKAASSGLIRLLPVIRYGRLRGISWTAAGIQFFWTRRS